MGLSQLQEDVLELVHQTLTFLTAPRRRNILKRQAHAILHNRQPEDNTFEERGEGERVIMSGNPSLVGEDMLARRGSERTSSSVSMRPKGTGFPEPLSYGMSSLSITSRSISR